MYDMYILHSLVTGSAIILSVRYQSVCFECISRCNDIDIRCRKAIIVIPVYDVGVYKASKKVTLTRL